MTTHTLTAAVLLAVLLSIIGPAVDMFQSAGDDIRNATTTTEEK